MKLRWLGKVGDTITAVTTPENATNVASYAWSINGTAVEGATSATFTVPTTAAIGDKIKVVVTDSEGKTFESDEATVSKKSDEEVSKEVTISDASGLQTDGTGLVDDTLELSYGSEVGTPNSITWYRDSKILATYTDKASSYGPTNGLSIGTAVDGTSPDTDKTGKYWAVIATADGKSIKSNEIELTEVEQRAVIKSFTIEDDYETGITTTTGATELSYATDDDKAVATLVLNKAYKGRVKIYAATDKTFTNAIGAANKVTGDVDLTTATAVSFVTVSKTKNTIQEAEAKGKTGAVQTGVSNVGTRYVADDGTTTYRWTIDYANGATNNMVRGTAYVATFDQTEITDDTVGQNKENISEAATVPYLVAPSTIAVTKRVAASVPEVTVYDAAGNKMEWLGQTAASTLTATGIASLSVFEEKGSSKVKASEKSQTAGTATANKGILVGNSALSATGFTYYWAEMKTTKGVYGKDQITLESDLVEGASAIAGTPVLSQNKTNANTADVELTNVKAPGTLYILNDDNYTGATNSDANIRSWALGSVKVAKGDTKASVEGVITKADTYAAVLIPDDVENFTRVDSATVAIAAIPTTITGTPVVTGLGTGSAAGTITITGLVLKDQFGEAITGSAGALGTAGALATATDKVTAINNTKTKTEAATAATSIDATGAVSIVLTTSADIDAGDGFTYEIGLVNFKLILKAKSAVAFTGTPTPNNETTLFTVE